MLLDFVCFLGFLFDDKNQVYLAVKQTETKLNLQWLKAYFKCLNVTRDDVVRPLQKHCWLMQLLTFTHLDF